MKIINVKNLNKIKLILSKYSKIIKSNYPSVSSSTSVSVSPSITDYSKMSYRKARIIKHAPSWFLKFINKFLRL